MNSTHVWISDTWLTETLSTHVTFERLFASVNSHVPFYCVKVTECFSTHWTLSLIFFASDVASSVLLTWIPIHELRVAGVWTAVCRNQGILAATDMLLQLRGISEIFITLLAVVWLITSCLKLSVSCLLLTGENLLRWMNLSCIQFFILFIICFIQLLHWLISTHISWTLQSTNLHTHN